MSLESANASTTATAATTTTPADESNNIVELNAANKSVAAAVETAMDTSNDAAKTTPKDVEIVTTTTTINVGGGGGGGVDVEAAKMKGNYEVSANERSLGNNAAADAVDAKTTSIVVVNGENGGDAAAKADKATTKTTITSSILLPAKQQQDHSMAMDGANMPAGNNANSTGKMESDAGLINFKVLYVVTQLCGLTMIILVGSYIGVHAGGFGGTSNPSLEFNWHPFLMTIGLIFLYGNSILIYRGFRTTRKKTLKITHAAIHMGAFVLTVIALQTVFDSHNLAAKPIPNMYSLHSWLGLSAVLLFCMQYVAGFMAYLVPGLKEQYKIAYMPLHIYFGLFGFGLAIASALMGLTEKAIFSIQNYSALPNAGVMINMCGLSFVVFGGLVLYVATEPSYKRRPLPEDAVLLTGANE